MKLLVIALAFSGCGNSKPKTGRAIPNGHGLVVDAPAKWLDNGIGGAAGFHLDAEAGDFHLDELPAAEAGKTMEAVKKETEEVMFEKWISSDKTADGFKLIYVLDKLEMVGDEAKKDGTTFAFAVRRPIDNKVYSCSGAASTKEIAQEGVDLCMKVSTGE